MPRGYRTFSLPECPVGHFQTAVSTGRPSWHVESAEDLPPEITGFATVGITAGASTPDALIDEVEQALRAR